MRSDNSWLVSIGVVSIVLVVCGLALGGYILDGRTATLAAYNGFQSTVTVTIGEQSVMIPSREVHNLSVPAGPVDIHTVFTEGGEIEVVSADLTEHGRGLVVYNIGNRAILSKTFIVYGRGEAPDEQPITAQITVHKGVDYPFYEPPTTKEISGDREVDSILGSTDEGFSHWENVSYLYDQEAPLAASAHARAIMREGPVEARVVQAAANAPDAQDDIRLWCQQVTAEVPTGVERHRYCQTKRTDTDAVFDEYTALLAEHPDSALHHYLLGRVSDDAAARALYRRAVELDPTLGLAYKALAIHKAANTNDWAGMLELLDLAWKADDSLQWTTLNHRLRLRLAIGQSVGEVISQWRDEVGDPSAYTGLTYERMLNLSEQPDLLLTTMATIEAEFDIQSDSYRNGTMADVCVAANDLDCLRTIMAETELLRTFLVLSDGATEDERSWVAPAGFGPTKQNILCAVHELRQGRDASAHLRTIKEGSPVVAALLNTPPQTVAEAAPLVRSTTLSWRPIVWFSLYRLTDNPDFLAQAKVLALPNDLPITAER